MSLPLVGVAATWADAIPEAKALQSPIAAKTLANPEWTPEEALAGSLLVNEVALGQSARMQAAEATRLGGQPSAPVAPDRARLIDTLDSSRALLLDLSARLDRYDREDQLRFLLRDHFWERVSELTH